MKIKTKWILTMLLLVGISLILVLPASAGPRFRGGFFVGRGFGPWGWYDPFFYGPYGYYGMPYSNTGEVKLDTDLKDAEVFINGAYAGTVGKLKSMRLQPNTYTIEIRAPGHKQYAEKIFVVPGKTLRIHPDLRVDGQQ